MSRRLALALAALVLAGCSVHRREYACAAPPPPARPDPAAIWECHRDIVERATENREFTLREYAAAARFFSELTGIEAASLETPAGPVPAPELRQRVRAWDAWYEDHADGLFWDADARRVGFVPPSDGFTEPE